MRLSARRLLEASAELCDAMDVLQRQSLHRPAHALLRALLESIAYVVWLSADPPRHGELLWEATTPPFRNVLERIGWDEEYERTYRSLSEFVHPTEDRLHMYRELDTGTADGLLPELRPDGEMYVLSEVEGVPFVSFGMMDKEEAEGAYGLYLRVKALDVVLAGLLSLFGDGAAQRPWWPNAPAEQFALLLLQHGELADQMLTRPATLA